MRMQQDRNQQGFLHRAAYGNFGQLLNDEQLQNLEKHKYSSKGTTILDKYFQLFWNQVVKLCPEWLAPNAITLIGLVFNISGAVALFYYCPTATEDAPPWVFAYNAFTLFMYQTLDAIDGKQARRTGNSSPLGELFDHGCDSISCYLVSTTILCTIKGGDNPVALMVSALITGSGFYIAHWSTYITGFLEFGYVDVTEAQLMTIGLYLVTYVFGQDMWQFSAFILIPLKYYAYYACLIGLFVNVVIKHYYKITEGGAGPNKSTVAGTSVLSPMSNLLAVCFISIIILRSDTELVRNYPILVTSVVGLIFAKISNLLIIAHMTKSEITTCDKTIVYIGAGIYINRVCGHLIASHYLLLVSFVFVVYDLTIYLCRSYREIADHLKINILTVKPKSANSSYSSSSSSSAPQNSKSKSSSESPTKLPSSSQKTTSSETASSSTIGVRTRSQRAKEK